MRLGVVIMAGGEGRRLRAAGCPKALAPFAGTTLVDHQLRRVAALEPACVVVLLHHQAETIIVKQVDFVRTGAESAPMGTAGGLSLLPEGPEVWLVINVDHISDVDLVALRQDWSPPCTAVLWEVSVPVDEGVVELSDGCVVGWRERPVLRLPVTTGLYLFDAAALRDVLSGERVDMPELVARLMPGGVTAWMHRGTWFDAGTPERLAAAEAWWATR